MKRRCPRLIRHAACCEPWSRWRRHRPLRAHFRLPVEGRLSHRHGRRRRAAMASASAMASAQRCAGGHGPVDKAERGGFFRADEFRRQDISIAALRETARGQGHHRRRAEKPDLHARVWNCAVAPAMARSQLATNWQPAAEAIPSTAAITGFGQSRMASISAEHSAISASKKARPLSGALRATRISLRSCPAQKAGPPHRL